MHKTSLMLDVETLTARHPGAWRLLRQIRLAPTQSTLLAPLLVQLGSATGIGFYRTLALLLKADWQAHRGPPREWRPWEDTARFEWLQGDDANTSRRAEREALLLEQCALSCHVLAQAELAEPARRHAGECAVLAQGSEAERRSFIDDKRAWLRDELQYDELLALRQQVVAELEQARMQYLVITGRDAVERVEAAHRLALARYRLAVKASFTAQELDAHLAEAFRHEDPGSVLQVPLEPELRQALLDTVHAVREDRQALRRLAELWASGSAQIASPQDQEQAKKLFRRLARLIHPDPLQQREGYATIAAENRQRLVEIWHQASATNGVHVHLSRQRLINYLQNLQDWIAEAERILRCMSFHAPSRLLEGDTVGERHAQLRQATRDVRRHLHAVRDDIAQLEFDPQHAEHRRVIAMTEPERDAERERLRRLAERWNDEALRLETALVVRTASANRNDATQAPRTEAP